MGAKATEVSRHERGRRKKRSEPQIFKSRPVKTHFLRLTAAGCGAKLFVLKCFGITFKIKVEISPRGTRKMRSACAAVSSEEMLAI